jgi:hypothetical protein
VKLTSFRALQRQRHEAQKQWSEAYQKELGELKVGVYRSTEITLSQQKQLSLPRFAISPEANTEENPPGQTSFTTESKRLKRRFHTLSCASNRQTEFRARIKAPSWLLFTNALDICYPRAVPGWKFTMTAYRVVPQDSEVFKCVWRGDVIGLRKLFEEKKASPFDKVDIWWHGTSTPLLDVSNFCIDKFLLTFGQLAAENHKAEVCQLLLIEGGSSPNLGIRG